MKQNHKQRIDTSENSRQGQAQPLYFPPTTNEPQSSKLHEELQPAETPPKLTPWRWFVLHSFSPIWLPDNLRHPVIGYIVATLLQIAAVFITSLLLQLYPSFMFTDLLAVLAIALVALNWGAGPSLLATCLGVALLNFFIQAQRFAWTFDSISLVEALLFLLVGFTISVVASQFERTRRSANELASSLETERGRLEAVIETVPGAVSIHDAQGTIVRLNKMGLQNAGLERSREKLTDAQHTYAVRSPTGDALPLADFPIARALRGETVSGIELLYLDAEGQDRFASLSAAPLHDAHGRIDGAIAITHDVTTLRKSEREAAARANELEAIFEAMTDSVFVFDSNGQLLRLNASARKLFALHEQPAYSSHQMQERRYNFVPYGQDGQPLPEEQWPLYRVLNGEILASANAMDIAVRMPDGSQLLLSVSGAPMRNKEGNITGAVCICRDVTDRRQLESRTQDTLNALLAMAETLVLVPSDSSTITGQLSPIPGEESAAAGVSRVAQRLVELTRSVFGCQRVTITAIEPETHELRSIAAIGLTAEQERQWRMRRPDFRLSDLLDESAGTSPLQANEAVILDMTRPPFSDKPNPFNIRVLLITPMSVGDQIVGVLSLDFGSKDHEYTPEEIALARAVAKLAALVIERERLLRERADARASELALREANRRMDEFLGMTSHELKTPLTSIKGNTQLTVRQLRNSLQNFQKMQGMLESTERQIKLLDRLVNDLLDISRTQADHLELHLESCELAAIVREAVEEQRRVWPTRTITLDLPGETSVSVYADTDRINQVITNYLTNALKYSAEDRPVNVKLRIEDENMEQARVSVQDEGVGLSPGEQIHVWERFHRAPGVEVLSTSQSSMTGLGLGLYISKAIIEQHGGSVGIESTPDIGSTFWFTLPLVSQNT